MRVRLFLISLISLIFLVSPTNILATEIGSNIVTNYAHDNLQTLFDAHGSSFPLTIRLGPDVRDNPSSATALITDLLSVGFDLNDITWQPEDWEGYPAENFAAWAPVFKNLTGGTLSLFTEYNFLGANQDPAQFADILRQALFWQEQGIISIPLASTNFNISHPNFPSFVKAVEQNCPGCLAKLDKLSLSIYVGAFTQQKYQGDDWAVNDFLFQLNYALTNLKNATGVDFTNKPILITELGLWPDPHAYPLTERLSDVIKFAQALENALLTDPRFTDFDIEALSFLIMDDETGKQCLVYKDKQKGWTSQCEIIPGSGRPSDQCIYCGCQKASSVLFQPVTVCFSNVDEIVAGLFRIKKPEIADTSEIESERSAMVPMLRRHSQIASTDLQLAKKSESTGRIRLDVCDVTTGEYFKVPPMPALIPDFYHGLFNTSGLVLSMTAPQRAHYLYPGKDREGTSQHGPTLPELVGPDGIPLPLSTPQKGKNGTELSFTTGSCEANGSMTTCNVTVQGTEGSGHDWVHVYTPSGEKYMMGINAIGAGPLIYPIEIPLNKKSDSITLTFEVVNHDMGDESGNKPMDVKTCELKFDTTGKASCELDVGVSPTPTPRQCVPFGRHESLVKPIAIPPASSGLRFRAGMSLEDFLKSIGEAVGVCKTVQLLVTPELCLPYTQPVYDATEAPMVGHLTRSRDYVCESGEVTNIPLELVVGAGSETQEIPIQLTTNCRKAAEDDHSFLVNSYRRFSKLKNSLDSLLNNLRFSPRSP